MSETNDELLKKLKTCLEEEDGHSSTLLTGIVNILPKDVIKVDSGQMNGSSNPSRITSNLNRMSLGLGQLAKLRKFEKGENFSRFCERFQEYVQMTQIASDQLHIFFLQHVDDETYSMLKAVNLKEDEKQNCSQFCEIYKKAIYGSDSVPLKNEFLECRQAIDESISTFSIRLQEKASVAFSTDEAIDENCLLALMRGIRNSDIRRKLIESSVANFSEGLKLAKKLEKISSMFESELRPTAILKSNGSFIDNERQKDQRDVIAVSPSRRDRSRHGSGDSRGSYRSNSPWHRSRAEGPRHSRFRSREKENSLARTRSPSAMRSERRAGRSRESRATPSRPERRRCWACNRIGHLKRNCYARNRVAFHTEANDRNRLN